MLNGEHERIKRAVTAVMDALLSVDGIKTATKYVSKRLTVRATWVDNTEPGIERHSVALSMGTPNYAEREFIKDCVTAGEAFPVRRVQYKFPPERRAV